MTTSKTITETQKKELHSRLDAVLVAQAELQLFYKELGREHEIPAGHGIDANTGAIGPLPAR